MSVAKPETVAELLVLRSGLVFLEEAPTADLALDDNQQRGFLLELTNLGYVPSQRLTERVARATAAELVRARDLVIAARQRATGAPGKLEPMFRRFPAGVPDDTLALWWDRVIVHDLAAGPVFDARTVSLAFALDGDNGVFMPIVVDLETSRLHWLDAYSRGQLAQNNVATSRRSIGRIGPAMIAYFASGARAHMLDLARYHAAARCRRVVIRGQAHASIFVRGPDETPLAFLARLGAGTADAQVPLAELDLGASPVLAVVLRGDLALPEGSASYALFRLQLAPTLAAADLLT